MEKTWNDLVRKENENGLYSEDVLNESHRNGFLAESASAYDFENEGMGAYLTDYDYYRIWPLNPWARIWINDKLTLKHVLDGTEYGCYLPGYFFYSTPEGELAELMDATGSFVETLREKKIFACKPCNGAGAVGFHKLSYDEADEKFSIDGNEATSEEIERFPFDHPNYVFTEFLTPASPLAKIDPLIHTLRVLVVRPMNQDPFILATYLRFGRKEVDDGSGRNYVALDAGSTSHFVVHVDEEDGSYGDGRLVYATRVEPSLHHPDSGVAAEGRISCWDEVKGMVLGITRRLSPLQFLGFDIGITEQGPKIMEINSHSGIHYLQIFRPFMKDERFVEFYREKVAQIESMNDLELEGRAKIVR